MGSSSKQYRQNGRPPSSLSSIHATTTWHSLVETTVVSLAAMPGLLVCYEFARVFFSSNVVMYSWVIFLKCLHRSSMSFRNGRRRDRKMPLDQKLRTACARTHTHNTHSYAHGQEALRVPCRFRALGRQCRRERSNLQLRHITFLLKCVWRRFHL